MYLSQCKFKKSMTYSLMIILLAFVIAFSTGCRSNTKTEEKSSIETQEHIELLEEDMETTESIDESLIASEKAEDQEIDLQQNTEKEVVVETSKPSADDEKTTKEEPTAPQSAEKPESSRSEKENKPSSQPEARPEVITEVKPESQPEAKPENKPEGQPKESLNQVKETEIVSEEKASAVHDLVKGALVITGVGLKEDIILSASEWKLNNSDFVERIYSSNNNFNFHKIWKVRGYDLNALLKKGGLQSNKDYVIAFESSDGVVYKETLSSLNNRYRYTDFTKGREEKVQPVIGFFREELFDAIDPQPPVAWEDQRFTQQSLDKHSPRLYLGQKQGNPSDKNQPVFIRELVRIIVGE